MAPGPRRIALLHAGQLADGFDPNAPSLDALYAEDRTLAAAFGAAGCEAVQLAWSAPGVVWGDFDAVLVRSTWDYIDRLDAFLETLATIEASGCALFNDRATIAWNARKRYLLELAARGVPVLPTRLVSGPEDLASVPADWGRLVLKPEVGMGGAGVEVVERDALPARLARGGGVRLVQPFAEAVASEGEWSFVYLDGALSHTFVKRPASGDFRVQTIYGGTVHSAEADPGDRSRADAVLAGLPRRPLVARVDMVRHEGRLHLMELELIEPVLFFWLEPEAARRLVLATLARLGT